MDLPELPIINSTIKTPFNCPLCQRKIAGWVVTTYFACPNCEKALYSNTKRASNRGFCVGLFSYLIFAAIAYGLRNQDLLIQLIFQIFGGITPIVIGYITYRKTVVIKKWRE